ncbi:hypothetical protein [uncultured Chryseobacterium sp.]|uniref:hypothetical protein n=1 Tax=uncultured Chryseobacterium sp. TaxID=259322 RepID=UPI0025D51982|nr:hypothetical protein [uncultured Chryseobacterium sp.]
MKKILILLILFSLAGCRTKQRAVTVTEEIRTETARVKLDSLKETAVKQETKKAIDKTAQEKKDDFSGDITIKGKSDSLNPLEFHNVVNGDTMQVISIRGNADYVIQNRFQKSDKTKVESVKEEKLDVIQKAARDLVSKETIKDVAATVETKTRQITSRGFQAGAWIVWAVLGIVAILATGIYIYLKRK